MAAHPAACASPGEPGQRPRYEVAEIFRAHGEAWRETHPLDDEQWRVMWAVEHCRTAVLGGHVDECTSCGHEAISYNSCRNRHCPKCQALAQAKWLEGRQARILPVPYFHVVFTLPARLRPVARKNARVVYDLLFSAASATLLELGQDERRLGGMLGMTAVLHTWARDLSFHPHLHCVVTGGALAADGTRWIKGSARYLFPVRVLSKLFRGKFMDGLGRAWRAGRLRLDDDDPETFLRLRAALFRPSWVVYAKRPFAGPEAVFAYLGRYTHRVGISNHRLLHVDEHEVRIATRNGRVASMSPEAFIGRFLQHVLPPSYVKIRYYGLMAPTSVKTHLETARRLLRAAPQPERTAPVDWQARLLTLTGVDVTRCPVCHQATMRRSESVIPPLRSARGPPGAEAAA